MLHPRPPLVRWTRLLCALVSIVVGFVPAASSAQTSSCDAARPCPVEFGEPVFQTITNPQDANYWTLTLSGPGGFRIELTGLAANYRLYVYAPDSSLAGLSSRDGSADLVVEVQDARPGRYTIVVDSPEGQVTDTPYQLLAIRLLPSVTPPTVDAGCRAPTAWTASGRGQWCEDAAGAMLGHVDAPEDSSADRPARLRILATGATLRVFLNNVLQLKADDASFRAGAVGFRIFGDPDFPCDATFANLALVPR